MELQVDALGELAIHMIFSKLDPKDVAVVGCVSPRLRIYASDDSLWSDICFDELNLSAPLDPLGNFTSSFKEAYQIWRTSFVSYPWNLVRRVKYCWDTLRNWLDKNFPEVAVTLQKGTSEAEISEFESSLRIKLPLPTRLLYRFCNGQEIETGDSTCGGLIGGYCFYDHIVNVHLLPLSEVIVKTRELNHKMGFITKSKYIVVADSSTHSKKIFILDCTNGQLYVGTWNLLIDMEMLPCVPIGLVSLSTCYNGKAQQDALLLWLEELGSRLQNGFVKLRKEHVARSISLFPEVAPYCSLAVTHGVQVRASAVFVPEASYLQDEIKVFVFAYSVRMCLLPGGCKIDGKLSRSCQLFSRHWIIRANGVVVSNIYGDAVIGKFPLLVEGEGEFVYESCSQLNASQGSIEGSFMFVRGSLNCPDQEAFEVEVAPFPLQVPDYIF